MWPVKATARCVQDVGTGAQLSVLLDPNLQLINPVNVPHPLLDVVITGSSGNLYCWRPEVRPAHPPTRLKSRVRVSVCVCLCWCACLRGRGFAACPAAAVHHTTARMVRAAPAPWCCGLQHGLRPANRPARSASDRLASARAGRQWAPRHLLVLLLKRVEVAALACVAVAFPPALSLIATMPFALGCRPDLK